MIKGNNPSLLNVTYIKPQKKMGIDESFQVIYKTEDGNVYYSNEPAEADIYFVKPNHRNFYYNKPQERIENLNKVRVPISKIKYRIAEEAGDLGKQIIQKSYQMNDYKILNELYKWPYCFGCDFQPEFYFMKNWYEKYPLNIPTLTKATLDIEIDQIDYTINLNDIQNTSFAPVNVASIVLDETKEVFVFILKPFEPNYHNRNEKERNKRYEMYQKQLKDHNYLMSHLNEFIDDCHKSFDSTYGELKYHIKDYQHEIELIGDLFSVINKRKPNFCLIWNMRFDIQYLLYRIINLGYDPISIMCHPDFNNPRCYFVTDKSTFEINKQYDYFYCSSYTQYLCQMRNYSNIRKSQHKLKSYRLNAIADRELKDKKVEYPDATNIKTFPYRDWILFIKYNIKDSLLAMGIERKTNDLKTFYLRSQANLTPYNKIFKETYLLRNVRELYFEKEGWVQSNNLNIINNKENKFYGSKEEDDDLSFKGAINADPTMNDHVGQSVLNVKSNNVFMNCMDFDMGAFYPSIKIASNMDPGTLLYKASFNNNEFISGEMSNKSLNNQYLEKDKNNNIRDIDITGEAVNTFVGNNILTFGYNYLNMPSITDIMKRIKKEAI